MADGGAAVAIRIWCECDVVVAPPDGSERCITVIDVAAQTAIYSLLAQRGARFSRNAESPS